MRVAILVCLTIACSEDLLMDAQQCGNGIQETIEQCDDGANNSDTEANRCRTNCTLPLGKPVVTPPRGHLGLWTPH